MSGTTSGTLLTGDTPVVGRAGDVLVAPASAAAYGVLEALALADVASLVGVNYHPDGERYIAVLLNQDVEGDGAMRPNAAMRIGREYFTTALRDYADWQEKWWREAIQNSVDAGATRIDCLVEPVEEGCRVSCSDNGGGMDADTILNKFLVLGGTTKTGGATAGGFGKAKELLVLPWLAWELHSRDVIVTGSGMEYERGRGSYRDGTRLSVVMAPDQTTHEAAALAFIGKCYLPEVSFTVNGAKAKADLRVGDLVREWSAANLYYDKARTFRQKLLVRARGLYMFDEWVSEAVAGTLLVEITKPSVEVLTANRDGFRDYETRREVHSFVNELAADVKSALRKKQGLVRTKFRGSGKFLAQTRRELEADMFARLGTMDPGEPRRLALSQEQEEAIYAVLAEVSRRAGAADESRGAVADEPVGDVGEIASAALAREMISGTDFRGASQVEAAVKQLAWQPDFFIVNEVEGFRVPKRFYPENMTPGLRKLAKLWAELCRFVLIQLGSNAEYGVGFVFEDGVGATYIHEDGEDWLMLNPLRGGEVKTYASKLWTLSASKADDVKWLYAAALHECTHMADGISYHDESFAAALTRNIAKTAGSDRTVQKIRRMVVARGKQA